MPIFDYLCTCGSRSEEIFLAGDVRPPDELACHCGSSKIRLAGMPYVRISGKLPPMDNIDEIWEGTPLAGNTDGVNQAHYVSTKRQFST